MTIFVTNPIWFATKINKNNVNENKLKFLTSLRGMLSPTIFVVKSMTHSIAFCFPLGFNDRLRVNAKTSKKTITHVKMIIVVTVPSNHTGPIWKTQDFSSNSVHLSSQRLASARGCLALLLKILSYVTTRERKFQRIFLKFFE